VSERNKYSNVYDVILEPIGADEKGYLLQEKVTLEIAKKCGGAVVLGPAGYTEIDPQGKYVPSKKANQKSVVDAKDAQHN